MSDSVINIERVIKRLKQRGFTNAQIARIAGVDIVTVWRWKEGRMTPGLDRVNRLVQALNDK